MCTAMSAPKVTILAPFFYTLSGLPCFSQRKPCGDAAWSRLRYSTYKQRHYWHFLKDGQGARGITQMFPRFYPLCTHNAVPLNGCAAHLLQIIHNDISSSKINWREPSHKIEKVLFILQVEICLQDWKLGLLGPFIVYKWKDLERFLFQNEHRTPPPHPAAVPLLGIGLGGGVWG